jgi:myosin-5
MRYGQLNIYTYSGIVLIATNPFQRVDNLYTQDIIQAYSGKRRGELEPHLFAIAEDAYRCMLRDNKNQTIVVSGESGAGKTVSAKYIMRYFATVEDPDHPRKVASKSSSSHDALSETEEQILATNPIMEAFGNAKTTRNDNSSRFGKYLEILFDKQINIIGATIRTYLLERSRLVFQPSTERNYHIFYQFCRGASDEDRERLGLLPIEEFEYLNQGGEPDIPNVDDAEEFKATCKALSTVGIGSDVQSNLFSILAALLHIGNIKITATRTDAVLASDEPSLTKVCELLGY